MSAIFTEVNGTMTTLSKCSWYFIEACGCASGVHIAFLEGGGHTPIATPDDAWKVWYKNDDPRLMQRDREAGCRMELGLSADVANRLVPDCPHTPSWGRTPAPVIPGYEWAITEWPSRKTVLLHLVATPEIGLKEYPHSIATPACGQNVKNRWTNSAYVMGGRVECPKCLAIARVAVSA